MVSGMEVPRKFLLLSMCGLGDAVCYLPFLKALRVSYPQSRIVVVVATDQARDIIAANLQDVEVIVFNRSRHRGLFGLARLLLAFRQCRFDVVMSRAPIDSLRVPLFAFLSGAKNRVGAKSERLAFLYGRRVSVQRDVHVVERYRQLLKGVGVEVSTESFFPVLDPPAEAKRSALRLWEDAGLCKASQVIGFALGADTTMRGRWIPGLMRWNAQGYADVARWLAEEAGTRIAVFGAGAESSLAEAIAAESGVSVANLCGKTRVGELQWLLRKCKALVSNDTGTMHLAAALGTPVVALFGPTSPKSFAPMGDRHLVIQGPAPCSPCFPHPICNQGTCRAMDAISPLQVIQGLSGLLYSRSAASSHSPLTPAG